MEYKRRCPQCHRELVFTDDDIREGIKGGRYFFRGHDKPNGQRCPEYMEAPPKKKPDEKKK